MGGIAEQYQRQHSHCGSFLVSFHSPVLLPVPLPSTSSHTMWSQLCTPHPLRPRHQHHGPRQSSGRCHSSVLTSLSLLYTLITQCILLTTATLLGVASLLLSGQMLTMPAALAHSPPRSGYYDATNNPVRSLLTNARPFARLPISPYYASSYNRRYSPALVGLKVDSSKTRGVGESKDPRPPSAGRPLMDPYY